MDYTLPPEIYEQLASPASAYVEQRPDAMTRLFAMQSAASDAEKEAAEKDKVKGLRLQAVRQEALKQGTMTGLDWRYEQIESMLDLNVGLLDRVFNFTPFVEKGRVLVPAINSADGVMEFEKEDYTEVAASFTIADEARIVSVVPTFRDYLYASYEPPEPPHQVLLPTTPREREVWIEGVEEGWRLGVHQADQIFADNVYQLEHAINGRINYLRLASMGYIEPADLKVTKMGVTYKGRTMNVGESLYQINGEARFRPASDWRAVWEAGDAEPDGALE